MMVHHDTCRLCAKPSDRLRAYWWEAEPIDGLCASCAGQTLRFGAVVVAEGEWMDEGSCIEADPDIFFPRQGDDARCAQAICLRCPVREPCLRYSLAAREKYGIWGGLSERVRRRLWLRMDRGELTFDEAVSEGLGRLERRLTVVDDDFDLDEDLAWEGA